MPKPAAQWDEQYILSLPLGENDGFERKGTRLLDLTQGASEDSVRDELAKQLSAFANTGGGSLIYGLTNDVKVELGGVSQTIKGHTPTKEWLEDLIPRLTDYEIVGVNVYDVLPKGENSQIQTGKALYVVDIPDSDRAPHQSTRDWRYYVRLGAKSQPAPHKLIEDIRNRSRHPNVSLDATVEQTIISSLSQPSPAFVTARFMVPIRIQLTNRGRIKATNTCLLIELGQNVSFEGYEGASVVDYRIMPKARHFGEVKHPLYPEMESSFQFVVGCIGRFELGVARKWLLPGTSQGLAEIALPWKVFADSAPPKSGVLELRTMGMKEKIERALEQHAGWRSLGPPFSNT